METCHKGPLPDTILMHVYVPQVFRVLDLDDLICWSSHLGSRFTTVTGYVEAFRFDTMQNLHRNTAQFWQCGDI